MTDETIWVGAIVISFLIAVGFGCLFGSIGVFFGTWALSTVVWVILGVWAKMRMIS